MFDYNTDTNRRNEILFNGRDPWKHKYSGLTESFECNLETLETLISERFLNEEDSIGESAVSAKDLIDWVKANDCADKAVFSGYAASPERSDYRACLDGIAISGDLPIGLILDFANEFHDADHFKVDIHRCHAAWN